jgi:hypothetical protein
MSDDETAERMIKSLQTHIKGVVGSEGFSTVRLALLLSPL